MLCCKTPVLGLGLGVDFTFALGNNNDSNNDNNEKNKFDTEDQVLFTTKLAGYNSLFWAWPCSVPACLMSFFFRSYWEILFLSALEIT